MEQTVLDNINSQPQVLNSAFINREQFTRPFIEKLEREGIKKIIFLGSGTSFNVSTLAAYYFKHLAGVYAEAYYPTVFKLHEQIDWSKTINPQHVLCVGISQSGTSVSTCEALDYAQRLGCKTLALTSNRKSTITQFSEVSVDLLVGEELTPPETKGYTVSVLSVLLWALETGLIKGSISQGEYEEYLKNIETLIKSYEVVLKESHSWYERNKASLVNSNRLIILGYGVDYASVLEGVLKVGEMLRIPTFGYEMEEYSHGPNMALNPNQSILLIGSEGPEFERLQVFQEVFKKYTDRVHILTCCALNKFDTRDLVLSVKPYPFVAPLAFAPVFQYIAAQGAQDIFIDTGIDPFKEPLSHYPKDIS
ncbi:SIS domain-containing protein [Lancefieldella parvula]